MPKMNLSHFEAGPCCSRCFTSVVLGNYHEEDGSGAGRRYAAYCFACFIAAIFRVELADVFGAWLANRT